MDLPSLPPGFDVRDAVSFLEAERLVCEFERILSHYGISIAVGSRLEKICFEIMEWERKRLGKEPINLGGDDRKLWSEANGLLDMIRRMVFLKNHRDFKNCIKHLNLLSKAVVSQNVNAFGTESNKIFELMMALVSMQAGGENTELDNPEHSTGNNPDVITSLDGSRWGLACKVLNGFSPITMFENLEIGINQIKNSPAEKGIVVFNLKNNIDHNILWPLQSWSNLEEPIGLLRQIANERHREFIEINGKEHIEALFKDNKAEPGALLFLQTGIGLQAPVGPVATLLGIFVFMNLSSNEYIPPELHLLNNAMHHRL